MTGDQVDDSAKLRDQVLSGDKPELQQLAASGLLPLPPAELIAIQIQLTAVADAATASAATESLAGTEPKLLAQVVRDGLEVASLEWLAHSQPHPLVLEQILRRKDASPALLMSMAGELTADLQETLLLRQDAIVEQPEILETLERNPALSSYSRRRITEYRRHLLRKEPAASAEPAEEVVPTEDEIEQISEEEVAAAVEEAKEEPAVGEVDEVTGLSESQLRTLALPIRLKLSRRAPRALRAILVRDTNSNVAVSVLENNPMSESEIEQIAKSRAVVDDVLSVIAKNRTWIRKYPIMLALVKNPKTQAGIAVKLAPRLSVRDLRQVSKDRNVANAVRSTAERLYKLKLA